MKTDPQTCPCGFLLSEGCAHAHCGLCGSDSFLKGMVRSDTPNSIFRFFSFLIFNFYCYTVYTCTCVCVCAHVRRCRKPFWSITTRMMAPASALFLPLSPQFILISVTSFGENRQAHDHCLSSLFSSHFLMWIYFAPPLNQDNYRTCIPLPSVFSALFAVSCFFTCFWLPRTRYSRSKLVSQHFRCRGTACVWSMLVSILIFQAILRGKH